MLFLTFKDTAPVLNSLKTCYPSNLKDNPKACWLSTPAKYAAVSQTFNVKEKSQLQTQPQRLYYSHGRNRDLKGPGSCSKTLVLGVLVLKPMLKGEDKVVQVRLSGPRRKVTIATKATDGRPHITISISP